MVKKIPLQNGMFALVDNEDYERCSNRTWQVNTNGKSLVVQSRGEVLSRFILKLDDKEFFVSPKDLNPLNFQKENLEIVDKNTYLQKAKGKKGNSIYKGVCFERSRGRYKAQIMVDGKQIFLGRYLSEDEAAEAYNVAARERFGKHAYQNIIGENNKAEFTGISKALQRRTRNALRGVRKEGNIYIARITEKKGMKHLGTFSTEEEAAQAYDKKAIELYGDKAILNFPEQKTKRH